MMPLTIYRQETNPLSSPTRWITSIAELDSLQLSQMGGLNFIAADDFLNFLVELLLAFLVGCQEVQRPGQHYVLSIKLGKKPF